MDPESYMGRNDAFAFSEKSIRRGFIRKVYFILTCQLGLTMAIAAIPVASEKARNFVYNHMAAFIIPAVIVQIVMIICISCCVNVRRKTPQNYIFLGIFTIAESFTVAIAAMSYNYKVVLTALGITAIVCLSLTLFAFQTKIDFTVCGAFLFVCSILLMIMGLVLVFVKDQGTQLPIIYSSLAIALFSIYLIYDTQLMMGGDHKYSISPEEYVFAALNLYLDIVIIFLHILRLVGGKN